MLLVIAACLCSILLLPISVEARGAGRAFPVDSENYVIQRFTEINSELEWDPTNHLVDLAGHYTNCDAAGSPSKTVTVDKLSPEGDSISGVVDSVDGSRADVDAVNGYIRSIIDGWINRHTYDSLIRGARRFGCSVRPGCRGSVVVGCLFSPGGRNLVQGDRPEDIVEVHAQAFTAEQYELTEQFTGNKWDRSHFLENLSGMETRCAMVNNDNWPFKELREVEKVHGIHITPIYGSSPNYGSTQDALDVILASFKQVNGAKELGCSLIPDCVIDHEMYVVVTCLYSEE